MSVTIYGLDVAKRDFHLHWVEPSTGEIRSRKMGKPELIDFLSKREIGMVALEACGSAHWWRRKLIAIGRQVVLLHPKHVRASVHGNKTDAADAQAIWTAVQQPGMRAVAGKIEEQQTVLALHRVRTALVKFRTAQVNQLRGLLYEFGLTFKSGRLAGVAEIRERTADIEEEIPELMLKLSPASEWPNCPAIVPIPKPNWCGSCPIVASVSKSGSSSTPIFTRPRGCR